MREQDQEFSSAEFEPAAIVTVVAGPFTRAEQLRRFMQALESLQGVGEVAILALERGMLSLGLQYVDPTPLLVRLQTLTEFPFQVDQHDEQSITVRWPDPTNGPTR